MANLLKLGTLLISGQPIKSQFYELHFEGKTPEITNTEFGKEITWIVVDGKLISRRCLLEGISFRDMESLLLTGPTIIYVNYPRLKSRASLARRDNDLKYCP